MRAAPGAEGFCLVIANEAVLGSGEDRSACAVDSGGGVLCVADGCGGIGSRRYETLQHCTEAAIAAQLAVDTACEWAAALDGQRLPANRREAQQVADQLQQALAARLAAFHQAYHNTEPSRVIMRGLQRTLPTTLCLGLVDAREPETLSLLFFWAGDSRGYVWSVDGLVQCTADHAAGSPDALENLYRDAKLTNMVNADAPFKIDVFGLRVTKPCIVLVATDGAFAYLSTPMEFELLLLETLKASASMDRWQANLQRRLARIASDDSTMVIACFGFSSFADVKAHFAQRMQSFQATYVTPVRRRRQSIASARALWAEYRKSYELSEEVRNADWRL